MTHRVAVVQESPGFLDRDRTLARAAELVEEAAATPKGVRHSIKTYDSTAKVMVVFPGGLLREGREDLA